MPSASKKYRLLHICNDPKFSTSFFDFLVRNHFDLTHHFLIQYRSKKSAAGDYPIPGLFAGNFFSPLPNILMLKYLFQSERILIHGLASPFLLLYLYLFPFLIKKCHWVIFGKDLYFYQTLPKVRLHHRLYEFFRKRVIRKIPHIITYVEGDYRLANQWYGCRARWHQYTYPTNIYKKINCPQKESGQLVCLAGNSADPTNQHLLIFSMLEKFKRDNIRIISPLSYGDKRYAKHVMQSGRRMFGENFTPLETLLPLNEYLNLLSNVDIAIFAHNRQQAVGTIINLLGMGKKVYIRQSVTTWDLFQAIGVVIYNLDEFNLSPLDEEIREHNKALIEKTFSERNLVSQWHRLLADMGAISEEKHPSQHQ